MRIKYVVVGMLLWTEAIGSARFVSAEPAMPSPLLTDAKALCKTAKETLAYLNKGPAYDPPVIHGGKVFTVPLLRVKATLAFLCRYQHQWQNPSFIKSHFDFIRWYPSFRASKANDKILMTKYYIHLAQGSTQSTRRYPFALYGLPRDEAGLSLEEAEARPQLIRFKYGKKAILQGALIKEPVPALVYLNREDIEAALLQGTIVVSLQTNQTKIYNVHRNNRIPYKRTISPYQQERYWYFKEVDGIKGYGKDAEHKITVHSGVTFAADLEAFGLGKVLLIQYPNQRGKQLTRVGIFADTGGAFVHNLFQVDFLAGAYPGQTAFYRASRHLPDNVTAYFMILKDKWVAQYQANGESFDKV